MRLWLAAAVLLLVPAAGAQGPAVATDLFVHLINVQDAPISPQMPPVDWSEDSGFAPALTARCVDGTTGDVTGGTTSQMFTRWRGYGMPRQVVYESLSANGAPRTSPARGVWGNVTIDTSAPMELHWFLKTSQPFAARGLGVDTPEAAAEAPAANVLVRAAIRSGDDISVDDEKYDEGRLLFESEAGPATLANGQVVADGAAGTIRAAGQHEGAWVYEFVLPLRALDSVLRVGEGYNLRVDVLMDNPACDDPNAPLAPGLLAHSSDGLRPRLAWTVLDPLAPGHAAFGFHPDTGEPMLSIHPATVFGPDDVKDVTIAFQRIAKDGSRTPIPYSSQLVQGYGPCGHDCGHTLDVQYMPDDDLAPGRYSLTVSYSNLQGTAQRVLSDELVIEPPAESPGVGPVLLLALLAGLAVVLRRR